MKTSALIFCQVLPENILDQFYEVLVIFLNKIVICVVEIFASLMMFG